MSAENSRPGVTLQENGKTTVTFTPTENEFVNSVVLDMIFEPFFPKVNSHDLNNDPEYQAMIKRLIEAGENPFDEL